MATQSPDLMQVLKADMRYTTQRQKVLAQNVANVDTPGYKAVDLKKPDFSKLVEQQSSQLAMAETSPEHINGTLGKGIPFAMDETKSLEVTPQGNSVDLEAQMANISETMTQHELSASLFKKFTGLYRAALGKN